jgi:hypothetical protein
VWGEAYYDAEQGMAIEEILKTIDNQVKKLQAPGSVYGV